MLQQVSSGGILGRKMSEGGACWGSSKASSQYRAVVCPQACVIVCVSVIASHSTGRQSEKCTCWRPTQERAVPEAKPGGVLSRKRRTEGALVEAEREPGIVLRSRASTDSPVDQLREAQAWTPPRASEAPP